MLHLKRFWIAEKKMKTRTLNGGIRNYLELQCKRLKSRTTNDSCWRYLKRFGTAEIISHKDAFACIIVTHSETIFETAMRRNSTCFEIRPRARNPRFILKIRTGIGALGCFLNDNLEIREIRAVNGAFCRYLIQCFDLQRKVWKQ